MVLTATTPLKLLALVMPIWGMHLFWKQSRSGRSQFS